MEFRKKYPALFPKVSLDRLEEIEETNYSKCTYCKYDPKSGGGGGGGGSSRSKGPKRGGGGERSGGSGRKSGGAKVRGGGNRRQGAGGRGKANSQYQSQIKNGNIPGSAGKDYPNFSLKQLEKKGFSGIQPAPEDLIPKNYPKQNGSRGGQKTGGRKTGGQKTGGQRSGGQKKSGGNCPGSLDTCMSACPSDVRVFKVCVKSCSNRCAK